MASSISSLVRIWKIRHLIFSSKTLASILIKKNTFNYNLKGIVYPVESPMPVKMSH